MDRHKVNRKFTALLFILLPLIIGVASNTTAAYGQTTTAKAIVIHADYVFGKKSGAPSFSDLRKAGFTIVGTIVDPGKSYDASDWMTFKTWVTSAKAAGFVTMLDFWGDASTALALVKRTAWTGADILALDELLSASHLTQAQLVSVLKAGLKVNPKVSFIMNEYNPVPLQEAYAWTTGYPVRVAGDDYYNLNFIDLNIKTAQTYGKRPATWLIFARGSQNFACYTDLNTWLAYVKQRPVDAFFWFVDPAGTWQANWQAVASF